MTSVLLRIFIIFTSAVLSLPSPGPPGQQDLGGREKEAERSNLTVSSDCRDCVGASVCPSPELPVKVNNQCVEGSRVTRPCNFSEQCQYYDTAAVCVELQGLQVSQCDCRTGWQLQASKEGGVLACHVLQPQPSSDELATLAGLGLGLTGLTCLICFTFKLFSKARTVEARGYGDASQLPQLLVEGKDVSQELENCSRTSSKSRIYTPGPPLTPSQVRRMSELSSLSVTVQEKDFTVRPVSPGASVGGSLDLLFERDKSVEHQLTIIPRMGSVKRRKSLVNHAFPELHKKPHSSSNSLLILTKTRTDGEGRRHSVAVPLLAAPPAQAPGWLIERRARRLQQRRHSLQVPPGAASRSRSPRRQSSIRQSSRRPSRQGFYQFLEQAVAT